MTSTPLQTIKNRSTQYYTVLFFFFFTLLLCIPFTVHAQDGCVQAPIGAGVFSTLISAGATDNPLAAQTQTAAAIQTTICTPVPRIKIPGLNFTTAQELAENNVWTDPQDGSTYLFIPFLGEYISAVYRYGIALAGIVVVLILIVSGIQWIMGGASPDNIDAAKERIKHALTGLFIIATTYTFLYIINPELTSFKSLKIKLVGSTPFQSDHDEIPPGGAGFLPDGSHPMRPGLPPNGPPTEMNNKDRCIYNTFFAGSNLGDAIETEKIENAFGISGLDARVNKASAPMWRAAFTDVQNSTDPKVQGFLAWMRDFHNKSVPDLAGETDGRGAISSNSGRVGYNKDDEPLQHFTYSMHSTGLALDFMTRSNWDVHIASYQTTKGTLARRHCSNLKGIYEENEAVAELFNIPEYQLSDIPAKIDNCINEQLPWSSIPDEFVRIFESHKFYWGGHGWSGGEGKRSDSMHFEYLGACKDL
jgi:hypothetical protein